MHFHALGFENIQTGSATLVNRLQAKFDLSGADCVAYLGGFFFHQICSKYSFVAQMAGLDIGDFGAILARSICIMLDIVVLEAGPNLLKVGLPVGVVMMPIIRYVTVGIRRRRRVDRWIGRYWDHLNIDSIVFICTN